MSFERETDDHESGRHDAEHDDARNDLPEQRKAHPGDAGAHVTAACGELHGVEERRRRPLLAGNQRREQRQQHEHGGQYHNEAHRHARRNALAVEANEEARADDEQEERQQVGAQAERQVQCRRDERRDHGIRGHDGCHEQHDGRHGERDARDVAARAIVDEMPVWGRGDLRGLAAALAGALLGGRGRLALRLGAGGRFRLVRCGC